MCVVEVESGLGVGQLESVADGAVQVDLALVDEVDDGLETVVLQAAAANVQLFAGDDELVVLIGGDAEPMVMTRLALPAALQAVRKLPWKQAQSMTTVGP